MSHILVIGGTGMLRNVPLYFAFHGMTVSVIARDESKLDKLILSKGESGFINPVIVDYKKSNLLKEKLTNAADSYGKIDLAVSWIHSSAPEAPFIIARFLNNQNVTVKYFHIQGSASSNPVTNDNYFEKAFSQYNNINYRKIILGFIIDDNQSRWLTDVEISNGVIDAINKNKEQYIVGTVEPWDKRP
jgi:hypothetical protein